ncbi:MAG: sulfite exporter TauE/SafE family protein [Acidimicrobiales bacterium]
MLAASVALGWRLVVLAGAGVAGGVANGVAGGGTFITFPTMLALGVPALRANVSNTVGVLPSYLPGAATYRRHASTHAATLRLLIAPSVAGSLVGCALLFAGSAQTFRVAVPYLIGAATAVFALSPWITRRLEHVSHDAPSRRRALVCAVFVAAVYGSYFGAGLGIVLLAIMAVALPFSVHELQGLRAVLSTIIEVVAAVVFVVHGGLDWPAVAALLAGTAVGGWMGTRLITRLSPGVVRALVVVFGVATTLRLALSG